MRLLLFLTMALVAQAAIGATSTGTEFFVTSDGLLVTNFHVVESTTRIAVRFPGSQEIRTANIVRVDRANDLALLQVEGRFVPVDVASSSEVRRGTYVYALGFPRLSIQGYEPKLTDGIVSSLTGLADEPRTFQVSNPIQPGNSGGPYFYRMGESLALS